mmetsp:Transcript_8022/g.13341  ORF Transcript_8022/g.13341 Transcript_8022/m.13341 type:complete len:220 (+) Transcript_8022:36-695(+)
MNLVYFLSLALLPFLAWCDVGVQESSTKHVYSSELTGGKKLSLAGLGVRIKSIGPIKAKVYSVGLYLDRAVAAAKLAKFEDVDEKSLSHNRDFEKTLIDGDFEKSIVLRMARDVGADKMVSALADSVKPRLKSDMGALKQFQTILSEALADGGAKNNMIFRFDAPSTDKLNVHVGGKMQGSIQSPPLVNALYSVYLDEDAVSPTLKNHLAATVPSWLKK